MTVAKLKDGRTIVGAIWHWRPREGCFTLTDDDGGDPIRVDLADCISVITHGARVSVHSPPEGEDRDELERARDDGWM